uniref:C-type lectin domain-containing protein n=1 Tax=Oryzias melastigma TaxID=30732 RepID=A0A3B3C3Y4_ORYME
MSFSKYVHPVLNFLQHIFILSSCLLTRQYHYVGQSLNWTEAQTYCRQKYTDLATIETSEEMDKVMNIVSSAGYSSYFWTGLYSSINWRWSDGFKGSYYSSFNYNYNYWSSEDSFNSRGDQICMIVYWHSQHHHWSDSSCSSLFPFERYRLDEALFCETY